MCRQYSGMVGRDHNLEARIQHRGVKLIFGFLDEEVELGEGLAIADLNPVDSLERGSIVEALRGELPVAFVLRERARTPVLNRNGIKLHRR